MSYTIVKTMTRGIKELIYQLMLRIMLKIMPLINKIKRVLKILIIDFYEFPEKILNSKVNIYVTLR